MAVGQSRSQQRARLERGGFPELAPVDLSFKIQVGISMWPFLWGVGPRALAPLQDTELGRMPWGTAQPQGDVLWVWESSGALVMKAAGLHFALYPTASRLEATDT